MSAEIIAIVISTASLFVLMLTSMGSMFAWLRKDAHKQSERVDAQFEKVDAQFERVDVQFERVDARFEKVDEQFAEIRNDLTDLKIVVARIDERVTVVEGRPRSLVIATH